nr:MAG TPA: hypothetical protein [Caudoviricetes sp.]
MNIAEILKNCPEGTKLYSPIFGELSLVNVRLGAIYPICCRVVNSENAVGFAEDGKNNITDAEPTLFPSYDNRDWGKFDIHDPNKAERQLKPFDKVLVRDFDDRKWVCDFFEGIPTSSDYEYVCVLRGLVHQCIPYEGNEHLLGTTNKQQ